MGTFKRFFRPASPDVIKRASMRSKYLQTMMGDAPGAGTANLNLLNDILYKGREDRLERYRTYNAMDQDLDIARALDMIAEHCTSKDPKTKFPFVFEFRDDQVTSEDTDILNEMMRQWIRLNDLDNRIWRTVRNTVKYGDCFFIRDPDTYKLYAVPAQQVIGAYVNEQTFEVEAYHFVDLKFNISGLSANTPDATQQNTQGVLPQGPSAASRAAAKKGYKQEYVIDAAHVIHMSHSEGQEIGGNGQHDDIWPFGESFLEQIFKGYKQRELLEDSVLIHRVQRAPSRRVWYIDVGKMRPDRAESFMRKFMTEMQQKRVPNTFGGQDTIDTVYNPISQIEDYYLPQTAESRGSRVENLEGQQWTSLDDLKYFTSKILRGLRIPVSFMLGPEEGGALYNDGKIGTAYIQEQQFARFCERIQDLVDNHLDYEFKLFMKKREVQIHSSEFELKFVPPMNFDVYRENSLDEVRLAAYGSVAAYPHISKRKALIKYLGWTEDDVLENETMWLEEQRPDEAVSASQDGAGGFGMGGGGMMPPDMGMAGMPGQEGAGGEAGGEGGGAFGGGAGMAGGTSGSLGGASGMSTGGGGAAAAPMMSSRDPRKKPGSRQLSEADLGYKDLKPTPEVDDEDGDHDTSTDDTGKDDLYGKDDDHSRRPKVTLKHLRKLRKQKEENRRNLEKRLRLISKMYGAPPPDAGGGGMGGLGGPAAF